MIVTFQHMILLGLSRDSHISGRLSLLVFKLNDVILSAIVCVLSFCTWSFVWSVLCDHRFEYHAPAK